MSPRRPLEATHELVWVVRSLGKTDSGLLEFEMVPERRGQGPTVRFMLAEPGFPQAPEFRSVTVEAPRNGRGLLTADLARINLDNMLRLAYESAAGSKGTARWRQSLKGGRPVKIDRALLERVAEVAAREPERRRQAVAEAFRVSPRQATNYIRRAIDEGLMKD